MEKHDVSMSQQRKVDELPQRGISRRKLLKGSAAFAALWAGKKLFLEVPFARAETAGLQYDPGTDPLQLNPQLRDLAERFRLGTANRKLILQRLFDALSVKGTEGVEVVKSDGRPPRTAIETLGQGGDCTEFATLVVSLLREMKVPGGAMVVHFKKSPPAVDHMVPYAEIDGERLIIDLQTRRLGSTKRGEYSILLTFDYDQAASMYHREWGDHLREQERIKDAMTAYKRALEICDKDAYVNHKLAVLHEISGDMQTAARYLRRAAKLDPKRYGKAGHGSYNEELHRGEQALREERWEDCAEHFRNALESGERIKPQEKKIIKSYIDHCSRKIK